ncbi:SGNH/GDSL hydrolase family protein [Demequina maris]|uniref:SGNH/GDSL hydrolase family protein n=1 Tax=Demequina maris TaxID=1638982 RepID=UPI000782675C|nr:SGNH/GDSL hydrolase family protein [Demequina maris]
MARFDSGGFRARLGRDIGGMPLWAGLLVLAIFAAAAMFFWKWPSPASSPAAAPTSGAGSALESPSPDASEPSPSATPTGPPPVALFIGDEITAGAAASDEDLSWTSIVATAQGWDAVVYGRGGTGYFTSAGEDECGRAYCPDYRGTIAEATLANVEPDVVVIAGGTHDEDAFYDHPRRVRNIIVLTYRAARTAFPDAQVIAVGPAWAEEDGNTDGHRKYARTVETAAEDVGGTYIDLYNTGVLEQTGIANAVGGGINDMGHQAIADAVDAALT